MNEKAKQSASSLVSRLKRGTEIISKFREQRVPIITSLLPRIYTNLDEALLSEGYYLVSFIVPNVLRDYLIFKRALIGEELVDNGMLPHTVYVDLAVVRFLCLLLLELDDYLNGALTQLSRILPYVASSPIEDMLKHIENIPPVVLEGIDVRKVTIENDNGEAEHQTQSGKGEEKPTPPRRRSRRKSARSSGADSEGEE